MSNATPLTRIRIQFGIFGSARTNQSHALFSLVQTIPSIPSVATRRLRRLATQTGKRVVIALGILALHALVVKVHGLVEAAGHGADGTLWASVLLGRVVACGARDRGRSGGGMDWRWWRRCIVVDGEAVFLAVGEVAARLAFLGTVAAGG